MRRMIITLNVSRLGGTSTQSAPTATPTTHVQPAVWPTRDWRANVAKCTCFLLPPEEWYTHYGTPEPGSMYEPNPDCPKHFSRPPHRLADGTWSDGVDRTKRINERYLTARYEVTVSRSSKRATVWQKPNHLQGTEFPTWREAIAYADAQARTTTNGETKS